MRRRERLNGCVSLLGTASSRGQVGPDNYCRVDVDTFSTNALWVTRFSITYRDLYLMLNHWVICVYPRNVSEVFVLSSIISSHPRFLDRRSQRPLMQHFMPVQPSSPYDLGSGSAHHKAEKISLTHNHSLETRLVFELLWQCPRMLKKIRYPATLRRAHLLSPYDDPIFDSTPRPCADRYSRRV